MKVWEALRDYYLSTGQLIVGKVTTGASTSIITDSKLSLTADAIIGGTLFMLKADGAIPEGEFQRIDDNTTNTITIDTVLSAVTTAGDTYGYTSNEFPTAALYMFVNRALQKLGRFPAKDTSITTAGEQTEYTFPVAIKKGDVMGVYYQGKLGDSNDNRWIKIPDFDLEPSTPGNTSLIILRQLPTSRTIKIEYKGLHGEVTAFDDEIDESIHTDLMNAALMNIFASARSEGALHSQDDFNTGFNKSQAELKDTKRDWKPWKPSEKAKVMTWDSRRHYQGDQNIRNIRRRGHR